MHAGGPTPSTSCMIAPFQDIWEIGIRCSFDGFLMGSIPKTLVACRYEGCHSQADSNCHTKISFLPSFDVNVINIHLKAYPFSLFFSFFPPFG